MKIFVYFVEPASYTLDLLNNVFNKFSADFIFLRSRSYSNSNISPILEYDFLDKKSIFSKIRFIISVWKKYDLIIINGYNTYPFMLSFLLNLFSFKKKYLAIESDTQLKIPSNIFKKFLKFIYLRTIFSDSHILGFAGGSRSHKDLFRYYGMTEERIFLMPLVVNNDKYVRKKFSEDFVFLFVGRFIKTKNIDVLCQVFLESFINKDAKLFLVGDGEEFIDLQQRFQHEKISFLGPLFGSELIEVYHKSSVFIFPSSVEAWGLVVNEALSASLPVIAHKNVGSTYDLIIGKDTGFVYDSTSQLSEYMLRLYNSPDLLSRLSNNAFNFMKSYWNFDLYELNLRKVINSFKL